MTNYDKDFYDWLQQQVTLLKERRFDVLDVDHLVMELESIARTEKRYLEHHLQLLLSYLLVWRFCAAKRTKQLELYIEEQRFIINKFLNDNPSFEHHINQVIHEVYPLAVIKAELDTEMFKRDFPMQCAWSIKTITHGSIHVL